MILRHNHTYRIPEVFPDLGNFLIYGYWWGETSPSSGNLASSAQFVFLYKLKSRVGRANDSPHPTFVSTWRGKNSYVPRHEFFPRHAARNSSPSGSVSFRNYFTPISCHPEWPRVCFLKLQKNTAYLGDGYAAVSLVNLRQISLPAQCAYLKSSASLAASFSPRASLFSATILPSLSRRYIVGTAFT